MGMIMPILLIGAGIYFGWRLRFFWLIHPLRTWRTLREAAASEDTSPFAALSMALAGTLGVGNIAGVATAITAGGAGAVLWMLIGALAAMSVKYAEVYLAVRYRRSRTERGRSAFYGGAMYYIRDGLSRRAKSKTGRRAAAVAGGIFALLCALNSYLTGNVIQVRAALSCSPLPPIWFGILFAAAVLIISGWRMGRVADISAVLIPALAAVFLLLSGGILLTQARQIPGVLCRIGREAFAPRAAAGGFLGFGISRAIRFGVTRGMFSNEAGCGTSPTAHACAHVKSAHHQGCFGIFEVFADTVVLCSVTALVILLYPDPEGLDGIELSLRAYSTLAAQIGGAWLGSLAEWILRISIILFALATVICQSCLGVEAIRYFVPARGARTVYRLLSAAAVIVGVLIPPGFLWNAADLVISVMTVLNVICLLLLRREVE